MIEMTVYYANANLLELEDGLKYGKTEWVYNEDFPGNFSYKRVYTNRVAAEAELRNHLHHLKRSLKEHGLPYNPPRPHEVIERSIEIDAVLLYFKEIHYGSVPVELRSAESFKVLTTDDKILNLYNYFSTKQYFQNPPHWVNTYYPGESYFELDEIATYKMVAACQSGKFQFPGKFGLEMYKAATGSDSGRPDNLRRLLKLESCHLTTEARLGSKSVYAAPTITKHCCLTRDGQPDTIWIFSEGYSEGYAFDICFSMEKLLEVLEGYTFRLQHPLIAEALEKVA